MLIMVPTAVQTDTLALPQINPNIVLMKKQVCSCCAKAWNFGLSCGQCNGAADVANIGFRMRGLTCSAGRCTASTSMHSCFARICRSKGRCAPAQMLCISGRFRTRRELVVSSYRTVPVPPGASEAEVSATVRFLEHVVWKSVETIERHPERR